MFLPKAYYLGIPTRARGLTTVEDLIKMMAELVSCYNCNICYVAG